jgi:[glutamine synthetase] adenylyltransferase / [glutamine synthetase]-adenylyl-L-tyrosine phosphorylase
MTMDSLIKEASSETPDPERAFKNLNGLFRASPGFLSEYLQHVGKIACLFSYSQFLADYCIENPGRLAEALQDLYSPVSRQLIMSEVSGKFEALAGSPLHLLRHEAIRLLRGTKKGHLLRVTIRDISGITGLIDSMTELSILAEAILELALHVSRMIMRKRFGDPSDNAISIIALGKLGAGELNYSSDIDIITVYRQGAHLSSGILSPSGVRVNKVSSHEYFCRLTETLSGILSSPTEDGIAYRVDLRLRPNGKKGEISLPLDSYTSYYEAWGRTWERVALLRARPVAGDIPLGESFLQVIEPFVWKGSMDYNDIDEIRGLKSRIDAIADVNDIKRGYGGIREIEFFVHTFQLLYGGERKRIRERAITTVLRELLREDLLSGEDTGTLSESYLFLRRLEHILQMKDDLQTHSLPSRPDELYILSRKMHFPNEREFSSELRLRRLKVRDMYISLFGGPETQYEVMAFLKGELTDDATTEYLSFKGFKNPGSALKNIKALYEYMSTGKTLRERTLLNKTIPLFLEQIVKSAYKDRALSVLVTFLEKIGIHESYIDVLLQRKDTREVLIMTFSTSTYFTRALLCLENLEGIFEYPDTRMDFRSLRERLIDTLTLAENPLEAVRDFKSMEEMKNGFLFMKGIVDVYRFSHILSMLAMTVIKAILAYLHAERDIAVIGLGAFGSRELNIGSDLDLIFVSPSEEYTSPVAAYRERGATEELIKMLTEYTARGVAYKVDMRLRPDGSKGMLVNNIQGYKNYYLKSAHLWEIQSLLKNRAIAGDRDLLAVFQQMKKQIIFQRGKEVSGADIREMRKRIIREVSKETSGYDLKLGPGGINEIEFLVQYLQLKHSARIPELIIQNTVTAIKRLIACGIIDGDTGGCLLHAHRFIRTVDTILRINDEEVLKGDFEVIRIVANFLNSPSPDALMKKIEDVRQTIVRIAGRLYEQEYLASPAVLRKGK